MNRISCWAVFALVVIVSPVMGGGGGSKYAVPAPLQFLLQSSIVGQYLNREYAHSRDTFQNVLDATALRVSELTGKPPRQRDLTPPGIAEQTVTAVLISMSETLTEAGAHDRANLFYLLSLRIQRTKTGRMFIPRDHRGPANLVWSAPNSLFLSELEAYLFTEALVLGVVVTHLFPAKLTDLVADVAERVLRTEPVDRTLAQKFIRAVDKLVVHAMLAPSLDELDPAIPESFEYLLLDPN